MVQKELDWLLHVGVMRMMDKLIEHPEFTGGVRRYHHADFLLVKKLVKLG